LEIRIRYKEDGAKIEILQGIIFGGKIHGFLPDDQTRFEIETAGQVWSGFWQGISDAQKTEFGLKFRLDQGVIFGLSGVEQQNYLIRGSYSNGGIKFTQSNYGTGGRTFYTGAIIKDGDSLSIKGYFSTTDLDGIFQFELTSPNSNNIQIDSAHPSRSQATPDAKNPPPDQSTNIEEKLSSVQHILTPIGTSLTSLNPFSTRYGKWTEIQIQKTSLTISGYSTKFFHLEKTRITATRFMTNFH
jgi:hypothetical protein